MPLLNDDDMVRHVVTEASSRGILRPASHSGPRIEYDGEARDKETCCRIDSCRMLHLCAVGAETLGRTDPIAAGERGTA